LFRRRKVKTQTNISEAEKFLIVKVAPTLFPELTTGEGGDLRTHLKANALCAVWEAGKKYFIGDRVVPTEDNQTGHKFKCVKVGLSGSEEPTWSPCGSLSDNEAHWAVDGIAPEFLWSINGAAYDAWMQKAGIAVASIGTTRGANTYNYQDIYSKCVEMANSFAEVYWK
jgi:hypothetical protein